MAPPFKTEDSTRDRDVRLDTTQHNTTKLKGKKVVNRKMLAGIGIGMATCLLSGSAWAIGDKLKAGEESTFAVPKISAPPKLDGTIDPAEWREAVAVSGTTCTGTDLLNPQPVIFWLAWDEQNLYMACRAWLPGGYKPRLHGGRVPGGADCFDDGLECLFKPMGKNVNYQNHATEFKFNISSVGYGGTYTRLVVGQILSNWEPDFDTAARLTAPGTAPGGGRWWEMEVAFSQDDFELTGANRAGDQWKLMLGLNHMPAVGWYQGRVPCIGGYFTPDGKSVATLVEDLPTVQMLVDSLSNVAADGTANLAVKAFNPTKAAAQVKLVLDVAGKIKRSETLELPAGGEKTFSINEKLPADVKEGRLTLKASSGETTLLSYIAPFEVGRQRERLQPVPDPDPNEFPFSAKFNPVRGLLQISGDSYFLPDPKAVKSLHYEVKQKETGNVIAAGEITNVYAWRFEDVLTLKKVKPGAYEATATLVLNDGTTFGPRSASFEKKDEAKAFAHWWGKDPGDSKRLLPPFTAIERVGKNGLFSLFQSRSAAAFTCWGREYAFDALGLPVAVTSQGGDVLAAPARIVVTVDGQETVVPVGKPKITEHKDWRVSFEGKAEGAGLVFAATGWMEQDGMVSVDLTYAPKDGKPVKVDALRIEYPVADDVAECLVSVGPGGNFAAATYTVLPTDKQGTLWTTLDTGKAGARMTVGSFYPHVWLGSEQRGLQWWADSDKGWFPDDQVPAHEVRRVQGSGFGVQGSVVALANHIIGKPVELAKAHTLNFTWIASPFKPLPKGWRMTIATEDGTFGVPHRGTRVNPKTGKKYTTKGLENWINPESYDPADWAGLWAEQKEKADASVKRQLPFDPWQARSGVTWQHMSFQLIGWGRKSMEDAVFNYFGDEWQASGNDTWNPTYRDYAMYLFDRAFGEGGVVSTYWDLSFPILFESPLSGLAWQLPDGRWQPGYNTLNCRRFFQRLWAVQDKHGLNPGAVGTHSTQAFIFPALPWLDAVTDGERDWNIDVSDLDWVDFYSKERMRAMSVPHNWGVAINWIANLASADRRKVIHGKTVQAEYVWMHDSWFSPYAMYSHIQRMPDTILDWGLNGEHVTYVPYWRNPYAGSGDPDLLVSLWRIPDEADGRILVGVFNYNRKEVKDVEVKLDLAKLGLAGKPLEMRDFWRDFLLGYSGDAGIRAALDMTNEQLGSAAEFDAAKGVLRFKALGAHRGRFIGIGATDPAAQQAFVAQLPAWAGEKTTLSRIQLQGFARAETQHFAAGQAPGVTCEDAAIQIGMWQLPDRVMLTVYNTDEAAAKNALLKLDLPALGLEQKLIWQEFIGVRQLHAEEKAPAPSLDYYGGTLTLKGIPAKGGRLIVVRKY